MRTRASAKSGTTTALDEGHGHEADCRRREHNNASWRRRAGPRDRVPPRGQRHHDQRYQYGQPTQIRERARDRRNNDNGGEKDGPQGGDPL